MLLDLFFVENNFVVLGGIDFNGKFVMIFFLEVFLVINDVVIFKRGRLNIFDIRLNIEMEILIVVSFIGFGI